MPASSGDYLIPSTYCVRVCCCLQGISSKKEGEWEGESIKTRPAVHFSPWGGEWRRVRGIWLTDRAQLDDWAFVSITAFYRDENRKTISSLFRKWITNNKYKFRTWIDWLSRTYVPDLDDRRWKEEDQRRSQQTVRTMHARTTHAVSQRIKEEQPQ